MFKWFKKLFSVKTETYTSTYVCKEEYRSNKPSTVQIGNHLFKNRGGTLNITMRNGKYFVNGKPLSEGLPDDVTLEIID